MQGAGNEGKSVDYGQWPQKHPQYPDGILWSARGSGTLKLVIRLPVMWLPPEVMLAGEYQQQTTLFKRS
ncbi:hypothetical protein PIIN_11666 [Serendipita indica DSM 11827]|uniref:Uncharacterized protein n=1 Tax=Serendipita indica (strain DSM 11827) TaxID=1109443 RepID=G4U295_SERID|nr:hypothetical protein PIIN_11666 [Serendipita indica DSM 11827]